MPDFDMLRLALAEGQGSHPACCMALPYPELFQRLLQSFGGPAALRALRGLRRRGRQAHTPDKHARLQGRGAAGRQPAQEQPTAEGSNTTTMRRRPLWFRSRETRTPFSQHLGVVTKSATDEGFLLERRIPSHHQTCVEPGDRRAYQAFARTRGRPCGHRWNQCGRWRGGHSGSAGRGGLRT